MRRAAIAACLLGLLAAPVAEARTAARTAALVEHLAGLPDGPRRPVLEAALAAYEDATSRGVVARTELLTVIDYSRPSTEPRLWVLDLETGRVLYRELVAHGQNSGHNLTERFSNAEGSHMTSLGLFVTADPYVGRNGYSLRLHGLDRGVNDNAFDRAIVVHGAPGRQPRHCPQARTARTQPRLPGGARRGRSRAHRHHQRRFGDLRLRTAGQRLPPHHLTVFGRRPDVPAGC